MQSSKIGHYKIISILGEGGMGIVYKALDERLERFVAIKILNSQALTNPQFVERFKREAKNQAKLTHPNIVPVFGFTEENRVLGIVMEFVDGVTLEQLINKKGRLGLQEGLSILKQILEGASYAHTKGFVHRDLKPSNIIINNDGVAKIMDFGISKSLNETKGITRTGTKLGTILYMSPEQIKALEPTNQSDIYSIGITFYEMLNGKNPFDLGTDYQIMEAHLKMNPPRLSTMVGNVGTDVDDIIAHALNKSTKKRYLTCDDFKKDIDDLVKKIEQSKNIPAVKTKIKPDTRKKNKAGKDGFFDFLWNSFPVPNKSVIPGKDNGKRELTGFKFYLFAFFFIIIITGMSLFLYDAVSGIWRNNNINSSREPGKQLESYKLNPGYITKTKWKLVNSSTSSQLNSIYFINDSLGFVCGLNGTFLKTTDGGNTWANLIDSLNEFSHSNFYDLSFTSTSNGQFTGYLTGDKGLILSYNPNTGDLKKINTIATVSLFKIYFSKNSNIGFIAGAEGTVMKTENGGLSWNKLVVPTQNLLYSIFFTGKNTGYISGWDGIILTTSDQGNSWILHKKISDQYLRGIYFVNKDLGFVVGGGGEIHRTKNAGEDWDLIKPGLISGLYYIKFFNESDGIILGSKGEVLVTEDSGNTWSINPSGQYAALTSLTITPSKKIFISGQNGVILTSN